MCLSVPYRVLRTDGETATVAHGERVREVSLLLLSEPVAVGDYVLVQIGDFAAERIDADAAEEALSLLREFA